MDELSPVHGLIPAFRGHLETCRLYRILGCSALDKNKPHTTGLAICRNWTTSVIQQVFFTDRSLTKVNNEQFI